MNSLYNEVHTGGAHSANHSVCARPFSFASCRHVFRINRVKNLHLQNSSGSGSVLSAEQSIYIENEEQLLDFCEKIQDSKMLAIDTEFVRERTYFHRLGLIQVASDDVCAAIDPISVPDLTPFLEIIKKPEILKVFHAAKQDLEIFYKLCGEAIGPIFDTQIAASLVGWGAQISFAKIVQKVSKKHICKAHRYTDWCRRPLSTGQIEYALDDVRYLTPVFWKLNAVVKKLNREEWVRGEMLYLENPKSFQLNDPQKQFLRLKNIRSLNPKQLAVLREITAWRELEAQSRDTLPKSIIRDETLLEVGRSTPTDMEGLRSLRGFHHKEIARSGKVLLKLIEDGLNCPDDQCPELPNADSYTAPKGVEELLAAGVQIRSEELRIEPNVLADRKQIHDFVKCYDRNENFENHFLFQSWRKKCIGETLCGILEGRVVLAVGPQKKVELVSRESELSGVASEGI
ncbi:MAG: ribonuclease D [Nitrospinae bacterium CG11_big_fil_rev_8_21_14_0_20_45_15]|nr:MAG: ribonuclease D [Nitrospinae bacterium CG11_big_fil_rev_8_21_14_0_20_45_15]